MKPRDGYVIAAILLVLAIGAAAFQWWAAKGWREEAERNATDLRREQEHRQAAIDSVKAVYIRAAGDSAIARADSAASLRQLLNERNPAEETQRLIHESRDLDGPAMRRDLLRPS